MSFLWRTDGHGTWYAVDRLETTDGLGVPVTDFIECECTEPYAVPDAHLGTCPVKCADIGLRAGIEQAAPSLPPCQECKGRRFVSACLGVKACSRCM
jgi:hypothetical protein